MEPVTDFSRLRVTDSPRKPRATLAELSPPFPRPPPPQYYEALTALHRLPGPAPDTCLQKYASETCLLGGWERPAQEQERSRGRSQSNAALLRSRPRDIPPRRRPPQDCFSYLDDFLPYPEVGVEGKAAPTPHPQRLADPAPSQPVHIMAGAAPRRTSLDCPGPGQARSAQPPRRAHSPATDVLASQGCPLAPPGRVFVSKSPSVDTCLHRLGGGTPWSSTGPGHQQQQERVGVGVGEMELLGVQCGKTFRSKSPSLDSGVFLEAVHAGPAPPRAPSAHPLPEGTAGGESLLPPAAGSLERRPSAQSLPDLSGPALDDLCPAGPSPPPPHNFLRAAGRTPPHSRAGQDGAPPPYPLQRASDHPKASIVPQDTRGVAGSDNLVVSRLSDNTGRRMHLDNYSGSQAASPEPLLPSELTCDLGGLISPLGESPHAGSPLGPPTAFSPPTISVEAPSESGCASSQLSTAMTALGELHGDLYLSAEEWPPSLENMLTALPCGSSLPQLVVTDPRPPQDQPLFSCSPPPSQQPAPTTDLLDLPPPEGFDMYLGTASPMSVSPGGSSLPSPFASNRGSFSSSRRRQCSASPMHVDGLDLQAIIRSSPTCLTTGSPAAPLSTSPSGGSYGHLLSRPEAVPPSQHPQHPHRGAYTFKALITDDSHHHHHHHNNNTTTTTTTNNNQQKVELKCEPHDQSPPAAQEGEDGRPCSPGDDDGPRYCRWVDCNALFGCREALSRHIEKAHIDQRKGDDFTCFWAACQRRYRPFNARYKLLIHMRVHSGEKPNKCTFNGCTKAFSRLENLKIHLRSHTGERPYICVYPHCMKAFSNSSDRAKHQRTHVDAKPYVCSVVGCKKRYTDPSSLRKHVKNHSAKEQALAKRKIHSSDDEIRGQTSPGLLLSPLGMDPSLQQEQFQYSDSAVPECRPGRRRSFQSAVPRSLQTAISGDLPDGSRAAGDLGAGVLAGGLGCVGEHLLSQHPIPGSEGLYSRNLDGSQVYEPPAVSYCQGHYGTQASMNSQPLYTYTSPGCPSPYRVQPYTHQHQHHQSPFSTHGT